MFGAVGTSVAMGNASPPVLAAATRVTASVDDDGFAKALAELGLIV
jgi:hydroxymethylpyrimidine pyrophosphatase-like HAD family hydrolase